MKNTQNAKILVIRLSSIGDVVLTTGFIRILRNLFPNSKIDYFTYTQYRSIIEFNPYINEIITCEKNVTDSALTIIKNNISQKQGNYDLIIDLHNNRLSNKISEDFGTEILKIDKRRLYKLGLVWLKKGKGEEYNKIHDIYLDTLRKFGAEDDNLGLEFWLDRDKQNKQYLPHDKKTFIIDKLNIVIAPGAHFKTKRWGALNFAILIRKIKPLSNSITLLGGIKDYKIAEIISELNPDVRNLCGETNLIETCTEISKADLVITNDTGLMHIAAARKIPVAAFFGSTVKEFGFEPYGTKNIIIEKELHCRPCSHIGRNFCPLVHFKCMNDITPDIAYYKILEFIKEINLHI